MKHCDNGGNKTELHPIWYRPSFMESHLGKKDPPPLAVARAFEKQTKIGWLQALMGLLAKNWVEIQNRHLQSLGENTPGKIWTSSLIRELWDSAWDFWDFWHRTLHATDGPIKIEIIELINKRVTRHLKKRGIGLPTRCHFLFHTSIHTLLTHPIRQLLSWMAAATRKRLHFRPHNPRRRLHDIDKLLLVRITMGRLIPTLPYINKEPQLQTMIWPCPSHSLHIKREDDPNTLTQNYHDLSLTHAWESR